MSPLHLIRVTVDLGALGKWAAERDYGWTVQRSREGRPRDTQFDEGRALHHLVSETFGKGELQPFRLMPAPGGVRGHLYAYSAESAKALVETARACALPEVLDVVDLEGLSGKPMPETWAEGRRLGFEARVRPTRRLMKPLPRTDGKAFAAGAELDAFLVEALRRFPDERDPDGNMTAAGRKREAVYTEWLGERLGAAAAIETAELAQFLRVKAARKDRSAEGPDAVLRGTLIVGDPSAFQERLQKGIGRHTAYGYGMLLLRPPGRG
ncbi:type I-E CRISPR-associated protein Cas6/Cse3/CasE [Amorphus sp. 3PC139-8]|uniref:type I-E CRISPR-associated protein Cas6/Cse3/CasE n=1 Tax=Amorphus sp. 3PC139-8 TaxID=2735676 RepID=UPI00345DDC30